MFVISFFIFRPPWTAGGEAAVVPSTPYSFEMKMRQFFLGYLRFEKKLEWTVLVCNLGVGGSTVSGDGAAAAAVSRRSWSGVSVAQGELQVFSPTPLLLLLLPFLLSFSFFFSFFVSSLFFVFLFVFFFFCRPPSSAC
jgi:hypothetical protein